MSIDVKQGRYWIAPMPDKKWGVFWHHPSLGSWHRLVATFASETRAESYADLENMWLGEDDPDLQQHGDEIAEKPPKALPPPPAKFTQEQMKAFPQLPPIRLVETFAMPLLDALPKMFEEHPTGITTAHVRERFSTNYLDACEAMRWLNAIGAGKWIYLKGRPGNQKILIPPDAEYIEHELSERQELVFEAMKDLADKRGIVNVPFTQIAAKAGISSNGLGTHLWALERKGYIILAKPAGRNGLAPAVYQILDEAAEKPVEAAWDDNLKTQNTH